MKTQKTCALLLQALTKKALARQERKGRNLAEENGIKVTEVYRERGLQQCLRKRKTLRYLHARAFYGRDIDFVIAYKARTISRNNSELFLIRMFLENCGTKLLFVKETPPPNF